MRARSHPVLPHQVPGVSPGTGIIAFTKTRAATGARAAASGAVNPPSDWATSTTSSRPLMAPATRPAYPGRPAVSSSPGRSTAVASCPAARSSGTTRCQYQAVPPAPGMSTKELTSQSECRRETGVTGQRVGVLLGDELEADVVRTGVEVAGKLSGDHGRAAMRDQRVDQGVAAAATQVFLGPAQAAQVGRVVDQSEVRSAHPAPAERSGPRRVVVKHHLVLGREEGPGAEQGTCLGGVLGGHQV